MDIEKVLQNEDPKELRTLFAFDNEDNDVILFKFRMWAVKHFPKYFSSPDAEFHNQIDLYNLMAYKGELTSFVDIAFRGAAKTARTKLFLAFCIANDQLHRRKYIKVLSEDGTNSKQIVTDIYNMLIHPLVVKTNPEIFQKTNAKREETMSSFTTSTGVKVRADTVGTDQRGAIQEEARPDLIWFEDFENRATLRSAVKTKSIWDNMEEARTGLAQGGGSIYTCNYISERGNVHVLVTKQSDKKVVLIVPILKDGLPTWSRYSLEQIEQMKIDDDDFEGERMCNPSAGADIVFDRETLDKMEARVPIREIAGFKMFYGYNPADRYAGGQDVAGGVGLDSSTNVIINFDTIPAKVVATYRNNEIKPDVFGDEIKRHGDRYGECVLAPEKNNHGHATIGRLKQIYDVSKIFRTQISETKVKLPDKKVVLYEYGWHTNAISKPKMLFDLAKAIENGWLELSDPDLIREARSYTRNDLMDKEEDPRLTTRHFDLLTACAIAWQMRNFADISERKKEQLDEAQRYLDTIDFDQFEVLPT